MLGELLRKTEQDYFLHLYRDFGITTLSVDETGCIFKEEELPKFLIPTESPEVGLEKILTLNRIAREILIRINFNYKIEISGSKITLEFFE